MSLRMGERANLLPSGWVGEELHGGKGCCKEAFPCHLPPADLLLLCLLSQIGGDGSSTMEGCWGSGDRRRGLLPAHLIEWA